MRRVVIIMMLVAGGCGAALLGGASSSATAQRGGDPARGQAIYAQSCSNCHGIDKRGIAGRGPSLADAGPASVDFYLSTGRMPLGRTGIEPVRAKPQFGRSDINSLIAYIDGDGAAIPEVDPARGSVSAGRRLFADSCSGCHQIMGQGGAAPGLVAPALDSATPTQVGEAIRVGPYYMPRFSQQQLTAQDVNSISRYVEDVVKKPDNAGGWGIGNLGPIPEGLVAFLIGGTAILLLTRLIGERLPRS